MSTAEAQPGLFDTFPGLPALIPSEAHQADLRSPREILMPNHRTAHRVKLMGLESGPSQTSAVVEAEVTPEPTTMVVAMAAEAVESMASAATDGPFAFRCQVDLAERRATRGREGMRPSPTAPEEAHTSHSGSGWLGERASAAWRENVPSSKLLTAGRNSERTRRTDKISHSQTTK